MGNGSDVDGSPRSYDRDGEQESERETPPGGGGGADDAHAGDEPSLPRRVVRKLRFHGDRWALIGGAVTAVVLVLGRLLVGSFYSQERALELFDALSDSALYLGSAMVTGASTILALMLTVVGLASDADRRFGRDLFNAFYTLALFAVIALCGAVLTLAVSAVPTTAVDELPTRFYPVLYDTLVVLVGVLSGLMVTVVLMLFQAIRTILIAYKPEEDDEA